MAAILQTPRLLLRELTACDLPDLEAMLMDPAVMYAYGGPFSHEDVRLWLDRQCQRYAHDGIGLWAVLHRHDGTFLGQCGLTLQDIPGKTVLEVGYLLCHTAWGQGYATEAAQACRDMAFFRHMSDSVYAIIRDSNLRSRAVAHRLGMHRVGHMVKHYRGIRMPHHIFRVSRPADFRLPARLHLLSE